MAETPDSSSGLVRFHRRWKAPVLLAAAMLVSEVGRRVGLPGLDGQVLSDFTRRGGGGQLRLYDLLTGGGLSRGAILALGIVPHIAARVYMRIGRSFMPRLQRASAAENKRWTRWLTFGLSLGQSAGFAVFVQTVPGAVAHPGLGFVLRTVLTLTAATTAMTLIADSLVPYHDGSEDARHESPTAVREETDPPPQPVAAAVGAPGGELLLGAGPVEPILARPREAEPGRTHHP
jgi:preprotein translocase subunit SecY